MHESVDELARHEKPPCECLCHCFAIVSNDAGPREYFGFPVKRYVFVAEVVAELMSRSKPLASSGMFGIHQDSGLPVRFCHRRDVCAREVVKWHDRHCDARPIDCLERIYLTA